MRRLVSFLTALLLFFIACPVKSYAVYPEITADAAVLMDLSNGKVYYAKNYYKQRAPASLTKIMTAVVALENGELDDVVNVSKNAASTSEGSIINLHINDKLTLRNLLKAALICSANDSTVAIAEHVGGSEDKFIKMMNAKARILGALNTRFSNTNGYTDPNHYSTAYDLALIARYAMKNPIFAQYVSSRKEVVEWYGQTRKEDINNTNRLLNSDYPGVDGVKTGSTPSAGNCLIASATRDDRRLLAVVLHSGDRYLDASRLLEYGFSEIETIYLCKAGEQITSVAVYNGIFPEIPVAAEKDVAVDLLRSDQTDLQRKINLIAAPIASPVQAGQKLGEVFFYLKGQELGRVNLVAAGAVPRKGWVMHLREKIFGYKENGIANLYNLAQFDDLAP